MIGSMMKKEKIKRIETYLDQLYPNPRCELNYNSDYELLIAIVLSAQTTDKRVNIVTKVLFDKYTLDGIANANIEEIEGILRPLGSFRKKASYIKEIANILHNNYQDKVPVDREILETFPGVGRKTANVFLSEYLQIPAIAVDTHVNRVSKRLGFAKESDSVLIVEKKLENSFAKENWAKRHLQLVLFGRYKCKAKKPECQDCKLYDICKEKKKSL